ncbi:MAG: hypothetical protein LBF81_05350 [Prevotellaceae bacterium]|jgi:hypothetical protein|nr:hypothetical protein [Prevotellaceae bacterium]
MNAIILKIMAAAPLVLAIFCWINYHLIHRDFEAYKRIEDDRYKHLCDLLNELKRAAGRSSTGAICPATENV